MMLLMSWYLTQQSQLAHAVSLEDFDDASSLKVAIAAAATNDTVGRVMSHLNVGELFYHSYQRALFTLIV